MNLDLAAWFAVRVIVLATSNHPYGEFDATTAAIPQPAPDAVESSAALVSGASLFAGDASGRVELLERELGNSNSAAEATDADEKYSNLYRKFSISLGGAAFSEFNTELRVNKGSVGTELDMEELLGLDGGDRTARLDGEFSFNRRHSIAFSYYDIARNGQRTIANPIDIGNVTIPAGGVKTDFDTEIIKLAYHYNFVADERTKISASFGFHVMHIDTSIESVNGPSSGSFRAFAPLPVFGLHGSYALSPTWMLSASSEIFQIQYDQFGGFLGDNRLTLEHDTFDHFGWGLGFNGFRLDGSVDGQSNTEAHLDYGYQGLFLYLRFYL